jgi:predicted metal-dependent HD superfamily phosphohydrolase
VSEFNRQRWGALWQNLGASGDPMPWFNRLQAAYAEGHRHYHNNVHIAECLREFDAAKHLAQHTEAVELAICFHDAVYNPKAPDNEERSAELARECVKRAGLGNALEHSVVQLILATKHHDVTIAPDAPLLVDIDLSIFGQPENRFFGYEAQIRQEYSWVTEPVFRTKRSDILEAFLARPRLYATDWFRHKYDQLARHNLLASLEKLKNLNA